MNLLPFDGVAIESAVQYAFHQELHIARRFAELGLIPRVCRT